MLIRTLKKKHDFLTGGLSAASLWAHRFFLITLLSVFFFPLNAYAQCEVPGRDALIGHWKLNESSGTLVDSSSQGNDGTSSGSPTYGVTGLIGDAMDFDGNNDRVNIGDLSIYDFAGANDTFTIAAWVNADEVSSDQRTIIAKYATSGNNRSWTLIINDTPAGAVNWGMSEDGTFSGTTFVDYETDNLFPTDTWLHVAVTVDIGTDIYNIYVNGVLEPSSHNNTKTTIDTIHSGTAQVAIGERIDGFDPFDGTIDDLRIYNRVLNAEEIYALYAQRSNATPSAGLLAYNAAYDLLQYCDGTDWRMAGVGPYSPNAVHFDGTNDYLDTGADLTSLSDSKQVTGSLWFRRDTSGSTEHFYNIVGNNFQLNMTATDLFHIEAENTSSTDILDVDSTTAITDTNWHHVMFSADLTSGSADDVHFYLDGVDDKTVNISINDLMDYTRTNHTIGASDGGGGEFEGDIADFWLDFETYIDLSVEANRRKFLSKNGTPMYLGEDGSIPTGSAPDIFFSGDTESWHTNKGSGGGFTENGELTHASSGPSDSIIFGSWGQVGNDLNISTGGDSTLAALDSTKIAYFNASDSDLRTYSFDGTNWSQIGNDLNIAGSGDPSLAALNTNTVAFIDDANENLTTYSFDGTNWTQVGNALNIASTNNPWLAALDSTTVAFIDETIEDLRTYSWDGTDWTQVGNDFSFSGMAHPSIAALSADKIAYIDDTDDELRTYSWDGTDWTQVGNDLSISGTVDPGITQLGDKTIAFLDDSANLQTYRFDGVNWAQVGTNTAVTGATNPDLATLGPNTIALIDSTNDDLRTYQFSNCLVSGVVKYNSNFSVMEYCNGSEWVAMGPIGGTPPTSGLAAHWKLDETSGSSIADSAGSNTGTWVDGGDDDVTGETVDGQLDTALTFDGVDNEITAADHSSLNPSDWTISAWFYVENTTADSQQSIIVKKFDSTRADYLMLFDQPSENLRCRYEDSSTTVTAEDSNQAPLQTWNLGTCVYNSTDNTLAAYLNGELVGGPTNGGATTPPDSNAVLRIGSSRPTDGDEFDGVIDDVRLYNRVLSTQEIQQLYHYGASGGLGDVSGNCSNPSRPEGSMFYNSDQDLLQYCNGENWVGVGN